MTPDLASLQKQWRGQDRFVVLLGDFGHGDAFLQLWQAWRADPQRPVRLHAVAMAPSPCSAETLRAWHGSAPWSALALALAARWPPLTRNLHRLVFDDGCVQLLLVVHPLREGLRELRVQVDTFLIDPPDLSADPAQGARRLAKALARLAVQGARVQADQATPALCEALTHAGFQAQAGRADSIPAGDAQPAHFVYGPRFSPRHAARPARPPVPPHEHHALVVGTGLAGCAMACALAELGWHSTLLDRATDLAQGASGNPAGLFHGVVHAQDGAHARFGRAAAFEAHSAIRQAIESHAALGATDGLLRLDTSGGDVQIMRRLLRRLGLPADYVQALDAADASARCGLPLLHPAWFYPGGGWVQPAALARSFVRRAGASVQFVGGQAVARLCAGDGIWQLLDAAGQPLAQGRTVVLANAADALRLLEARHWPVQSVRGQISLYDNAAATPALRLRLPCVPVAGAGYLLPPVEGQALFGASWHIGDDDAHVRDADHVFNLQRLQTLCSQPLPVPSTLRGRVAWRCVSDDGLPLVGAVPDESALCDRGIERLRDMPRRDGLYVLSGMASRGITWAALGAQVLAAQIAGAPLPLEASLSDALDPARFALRAARRQRKPCV